MMTATIHPATETEIEETETVKNDIAILKNHLPPTIEVPIVTVVEIMTLPVVEGTVQVEASMDHPVGEITVPVEVMAMITLLHGIESLVMIAGEVGQIDLTVQEVGEGMVVVGFGGRDRKRSASPKRPRGPTPDLTGVVPIDVRKRRLTMWDVKPAGYENVTAEQAKMSGKSFITFPLLTF